MARCYVVRKTCGHIVAAFPVNMDQNAKAEILKQFTKCGYDIEQTGEGEVGLAFSITCDCNKPPLLRAIDDVSYHRAGADYRKLETDAMEDDGADEEDIDAAGTDMEPEAEELLEADWPEEEYQPQGEPQESIDEEPPF